MPSPHINKQGHVSHHVSLSTFITLIYKPTTMQSQAGAGEECRVAGGFHSWLQSMKPPRTRGAASTASAADSVPTNRPRPEPALIPAARSPPLTVPRFVNWLGTGPMRGALSEPDTSIAMMNAAARLSVRVTVEGPARWSDIVYTKCVALPAAPE